jgi:hypothetical protein
MVLPVLALLMMALLEVASITRDVLLAHEAARAGARAAATSTGAGPVVSAAREAAPEVDLETSVVPVARSDGDVARVTVTVRRRGIGAPASIRITAVPTVRATAVARVEPVVDGAPSRVHGP